MNLLKKKAVMSVVFLVSTLTLKGQDFYMEKQLLSPGGGNTAMNGGPYSLSGSVGQITTEISEGDAVVIQAGFWQKNNDLIFENEFERGA